jgi:hypothetical protein
LSKYPGRHQLNNCNYQADFRTFYEAHFSQEALDGFALHFLNSNTSKSQIIGENGVEEDVDGLGFYEDGIDNEDEGLGFYEDGVKRTLTDEQIAMFRHSELEALRRTEEKLAQVKREDDITLASDGSEDGEIEEDDEQRAAVTMETNKKPRKRGWHTKPDLRKRTWDVVEKGLEGLVYDEEPNGENESRAQRRRVDCNMG